MQLSLWLLHPGEVLQLKQFNHALKYVMKNVYQNQRNMGFSLP